jgi:GrpB-like predicted nucleotidyltransferase (UPF0157 family)
VDRVHVVPYDADWPSRFQDIAIPIRRALGSVALRIDHIGSTAVPGLAAKPVIDVQISVASFEPLDNYRDPLQSLGYVFRADNPERTKRYFREAPTRPRTHVHVRRFGSWGEQYALLFRDYLRGHPTQAQRYADVKYRLASQFAGDRHSYTDAKQPFVWEIMGAADTWSQAVGWEPSASDA